MHLPRGLGRKRWREVVGAAYRVFRDPERTGDIITAEELTAQTQLAYLRDSGVMESGEGPDLMRDRPEFGDLNLDLLRAMPEGTLGRESARFFDANGLDTELYGVPTRYTEDEDAAYIMRRIRGSHDLWHVLMNFTIREHDEILLHAFSFAQTGLPSSLALMTLGGLKTMVLEARWGCATTGLRAAYRRGERAARLIPVYWERHYEEPLQSVRERLGIVPWTDADRAACEPWRFVGPAIGA
jgi:ubiquinone biosynthesis protein COQ4